MLKGRSRDPRAAGVAPPPPHLQAILRPPAMGHTPLRPPTPSMQRAAPIARPEPDYEVVEFPGEQYVNAKLQPPPPPPPRPPTGHPPDAGASCGLCGGGGARVRCAECGRRALCASCDDMYHRHPKRRHHQRQALSQTQLRDERPPLPPKAAPPVPPPRRHKVGGDRMSASPKPPTPDQRRATLSHHSGMMGLHGQNTGVSQINQQVTPQHLNHQMPLHLQTKITSTPTPSHVGSMPFLPTNMHVAAAPVTQTQGHNNTLSHMGTGWNRPRGSLQNFGLHPNMGMQPEQWENSENMAPAGQNWGRPMRRGASVLELSGGATTACAGCAHCAPMPWRYGSCASLDHPWAVPNPAWPAQCCTPPHPAHNVQMHPHPHNMYPPQTPQPYRRADSRAVSRAASRAGSRAASPAMSIRSRTSRRHKHRTPSPPPLPSSDADSESESESDHAPPPPTKQQEKEDSLGPAPSPPNSSWQCEHCTYVNEPGVRVCVVCCRTPISVPKPVTSVTQAQDICKNIERLKITPKQSPSPARVKEEPRVERVVEKSTKTRKERTSTGCGPSPPREANILKKPVNRLVTPTREPSVNNHRDVPQEKHDMAVGPSPPREVPNGVHTRREMSTDASPPRDTKTMRVSPYKDVRVSTRTEEPTRHSISVGPSPPREPSVSKSLQRSPINVQKKSTGTSPPRDTTTDRRSALTNNNSRSNVSNTGTSPPPQSISTQTYEVPNSWENAPSASRSRARRRFRDDSRRERSHSRHSLSSDTRESERSARTAAPGTRWEWRERDSSPGGDWGDGYSRLSRRASHLDLRRTRSTRRSTYYGSESISSQAPSPERQSTTRAISLEALAGAGARREAERGLELAQLMGEAERLGFSAAEVQAALTQSPAAPLAWLRERWPSLCAGVRAAAARLAPNAAITELEARAALARHRGAMWPAVTECVERHRRQKEALGVGEEGRLRGHVWGSPVGADDDAAPPRSSSRQSHRMREDSSDEFEAPTTPKFQDDDWMFLPLDIKIDDYKREAQFLESPLIENKNENKNDVAKKLKILLQEAGVPSIDENLLLKGLLSGNSTFLSIADTNVNLKPQSIDLIQSENDFIDAYNALTRSSPLPNIDENKNNTIPKKAKTESLISQETPVPNNKKITNNSKTNKGAKAQEKKITKGKKLPQIKDKLNGESQMDQLNDKLSSKNQVDQAPINVNSKTIQKRGSEKKQIERSPIVSNHKTAAPLKLQITKETNSKKNTSMEQTSTEQESQLQVDEKSKNLSDMVDNTQKLIQQMKEEINSDINSIDGRTASQSEIESSSEDTNDEQESSFSDTEARTDNLSSDEKEVTSSEDEGSEEEEVEEEGSEEVNSEEEEENEDAVVSDKQQMMLNRTSSEENEHFEEALDHVEIQLEDFKHANIEMLDSIARTLQEENTLAIEINEPKIENISISPKTQDLNNNVFIAVNSFEEIYQELNTKNNAKNDNTRMSQLIKTVLPPNNLNVLTKETIVNSVIEIPSPIKFVITENKIATLNANLEFIEVESPRDNIQNKNEITNVITANINKDQNYDEKTITQNISNRMLEKDVNNQKSQDFSDVIEQNSEMSGVATSNLHLESNPEQVDVNEADTIGSPYPSFATPLPEPVNYDESVITIENNSGNTRDVHIVVQTQIDIPTENIHSDLLPSSNNEKSKSPEKVIIDKTSENGIGKNAIVNKSSIPKLIKIIPNNKIKVDKNTPKLIVSKVPIRRSSIKQYPAPAPPKTHFGNIQSGHVKQLQTRLFDNKVIPSKPVPASSQITEVIASTSTLNKKKQAPPPPIKTQAEKHMSPPKISTPPKEKKQYFKETCRTEDEWTDSDSEDSQIQIERPNEESQYSPPSPPPPLTLRRVSGQLIDLAKIRLPEGSPERQARMLLAEGATETWEQAQLAVELVSRGAEPPAALLAALECTDLESALAYLYQDCELCASRLPEHEMVSMLRCTHRCCRECAHLYFTVQITERSIADCVCPYCKLPELESLPEDAWLEYFAHLDILLKTLLETDVHELFQRKLRDRTLARDPNFRWCMECSSGFFVHPKQKKIRCPECRSISCATCRKTWSANHEGLTCDQYTAWLDDNDPERSVTAIQQHLRDNGLECPRCHFKYSLSRGGCMHFTCTQCKYEFCYGCGKPFTMGARCGLSEYCAKLGLHAHHPRNCLFYLRDKEPHDLQTLLQMNNVNYETEQAEGSTGRCPVQLQRETPTGLIDGLCGSEAPANYAGLCKGHYVEYLAGLARGLDPIPIMDVPELVAELRRRALPLPERGPWDTDPIYAGMCAEIVKEKIPLD